MADWERPSVTRSRTLPSHRERRDAIDAAFDALSGVVDEVLSVTFDDVDFARTQLREHVGLSARDALHVSIMKRHGIGRILSFDDAFDQVIGIERIA